MHRSLLTPAATWCPIERWLVSVCSGQVMALFALGSPAIQQTFYQDDVGAEALCCWRYHLLESSGHGCTAGVTCTTR